MIGKTFDRWTVVSLEPERYRGKKRYLCRCRCGTMGVVVGSVLRSSLSRSCGCLKDGHWTLRHGHARKGRHSSTFTTWFHMKKRCNDPKAKEYENYGGRGISYDQRWEQFQNFLEDMGEKPAGLTLDRINNNGNYCKENCRWATAVEQARNRRITKLLTIKGQTKPLAEWAEVLGLKYDTLYKRIYRKASA